jgi:preprotein translocase subunit SecE
MSQHRRRSRHCWHDLILVAVFVLAAGLLLGILSVLFTALLTGGNT